VTNHRTPFTLLAVAAIAAFILAALITFNRVGMRQASNVTPPGTVGLAHPHPPLDTAPGVPVPPERDLHR
jgi:hypothetical protein